MRILNYNVAMHFPGYGDLVRADKIRQHLLQGDWDIIALEEVYHKSLRKVLLQDKNLEENYPHRVYNLKDYGESRFYTFDNGLALLSKHKIVRFQRYQYPSLIKKAYNLLLPPKDVLFAEIDYQGVRIGIFITHMQWGPNKEHIQYRYRHMRELRDFIEKVWGIEEKPLIIMGDLNIFGGIDEEEYKEFKKVFPELRDWYLESNDNLEDGYTWQPQNTKVLVPFRKQRFDYLFSNKHIEPITSSILKFKGRLHLQKVVWEPTERFSLWEDLYFKIARVSRTLFIPVLFIYYLFINLLRITRTLSVIYYYMKRDLSDHYALEGTGRISV